MYKLLFIWILKTILSDRFRDSNIFSCWGWRGWEENKKNIVDGGSKIDGLVEANFTLVRGGQSKHWYLNIVKPHFSHISRTWSGFIYISVFNNVFWSGGCVWWYILRSGPQRTVAWIEVAVFKEDVKTETRNKYIKWGGGNYTLWSGYYISVFILNIYNEALYRYNKIYLKKVKLFL